MKRFAAAAVLVLLSRASFAGDCTPENWRECQGRPWTVGDTMETPTGAKWWPSPLWGAGDEAGSTNWYTRPEVVKRALAEAKVGKVYSLGQPYTDNMPLFGARKYSLRIPATPTGGPLGGNQIVYHDDFLATEVGQVGTQFDALGHVGVAVDGPGNQREMRFYNGYTEAELASPTGLRKLGVEKLHPIVARGVLLDIAAARGVESLEAGQEVTLADVRAALKRQGLEKFKFMPGDFILFRTGWSRYWVKDNAKYLNGEPGIGMEVAKWLSDEVKAGGVGADAWAVEVIPNSDPLCAFCVHTHMLARHGIVLQENLNLDALAQDKAYTFLYIFSPVPFAGASGSPGSPLAIK